MGKEYLTSNNFVRLKENSNEKEKTLDNKKTNAKKVKKISKSKVVEEIKTNIEVNSSPEDKIAKRKVDNKEVVFLEKQDEVEPTEEINNARKKRRRSSANIE